VAYLESESLEPWAPTRLKVLDWPGGTEQVVATQLVGAANPTWSADGRSLRVLARTGAGARQAQRGWQVEVVNGVRATPASAADAAAEDPITVEWQPPPPPADYVVEVGRLFDGVRGTYQRHVDVHVRSGRIAAIVGRGLLPSPGNTLDARDATVIPGLIDVHVHETAQIGERLGRAWLAYGVTTVREITSSPLEALERSEIWASGRAPGPRLLISTTAASPPSLEPRLPIRAYPGIANGFAHSLRQQAARLEVPHLNAAVFSERLRLESLAERVELELSPGFVAYQDGFSRLLASGATFVTGLAALAGLHDWPAPASRFGGPDPAYRTLFTRAEQSAWERPDPIAASVPMLEDTVTRLVRGGGRVAIGSDAPAVPYGLGVHLELALLARAGLAPDQILRMATVQGALALGAEQQIGSIEVGKLADFVVLNGDPLQDIGDTLRIVAVVKGGVWHERRTLLAPP
jgi:hypothetical protein